MDIGWLEENKEFGPLYKMSGIQFNTMEQGDNSETMLLDRYLLVVHLSGGGGMDIDEKSLLLGNDTVYIVPPGAVFSVQAKADTGLSWIGLAFESIGIAPDGRGNELPCLGSIDYQPRGKLIDELQELASGFRSSEAMERYENHIRFELLLLSICRQNAGPGSVRSMRKMVEATLDRIHSHYSEEFRVDELAQTCNMSTRHYTRIFTELTGTSPIEYLTALRIKRSLKGLVTSGGKLKSIARDVGYTDSYYYSRRFKEKMGMSPTGYVTNWRKAPRIVALQCVGDLLALGIKPVGVMEYNLSKPLSERLADVELVDLTSRGLGKIASLQPDLIVAGNYLHPDLVDILCKIAPVAEVAWSGVERFYHLHRLADMLGKQEEKTAWLARYERKQEQVRERMAPLIAKGETAAVLYMWKNEIRLFAPRIFSTFYQALQFQAPASLKGWNVRDEQFGSISVPFERFHEVAADWIFAIIQDETAMEMFKRLRLAYKNELSAFADNKVYALDPDWHNFDATSLYWQLEKVDAIFEKNRS